MDESNELPVKVELVGSKGPVLVARIVAPLSHGIRRELLVGYAENRAAAYGAALFYSCVGARKNVAEGSNIVKTGRAVRDWLLGEGVPEHEINEAGSIAWTHCVRDLPDLEAVRAAAGFSAATPAGSTG